MGYNKMQNNSMPKIRWAQSPEVLRAFQRDVELK